MELIIMRGLPSCGKSYVAEQLAAGKNVICSADHFFGKTPKEYVANFSPDKLAQAHAACQEKARKLMSEKSEIVIIDNTNCSSREYATYIEMANEYGYEYRFEYPTSKWWKSIFPHLNTRAKNWDILNKMAMEIAKRSEKSHKVPYETIQIMMDRWEVVS